MTHPTLHEEKALWDKGFEYVIGIDEVGRGSFAGPVMVGAVVFPKRISSELLNGVNDSKLLSELRRNNLYPRIKKHALFSKTASSSVSCIEKIGVGKATEQAFRTVIATCLKKLNSNSVFVLVDAFYIPHVKSIGKIKQKAIVKGDQKSFSIAAASIIAKVERDRYMIRLSDMYPQFSFHKNKGYGTLSHRLAIQTHGLSKVHRRSFCIP